MHKAAIVVTLCAAAYPPLRTSRVQRTKRLLDDTDLTTAQIAFAAGFGSLRRFNAVFAEVYRRPPREVRGSRPA